MTLPQHNVSAFNPQLLGNGDVKMNLKIGTVIYELRKQHDVTQEQLANVIGVSVPAISKWENGVSQTKGY